MWIFERSEPKRDPMLGVNSNCNFLYLLFQVYRIVTDSLFRLRVTTLEFKDLESQLLIFVPQITITLHYRDILFFVVKGQRLLPSGRHLKKWRSLLSKWPSLEKWRSLLMTLPSARHFKWRHFSKFLEKFFCFIFAFWAILHHLKWKKFFENF